MLDKKKADADNIGESIILFLNYLYFNQIVSEVQI